MKKDVYFYTEKKGNVIMRIIKTVYCWQTDDRKAFKTYINIYKCNNDHILSRFKIFTLDYIENRELTASLPKTKNLRLKPYGII